MASVSDVTPFLRRPRVGPSKKARPFMKLEWGKLFAEATEKDTKLKVDEEDKETYYDDEFYESEEDVSKKCVEQEEDRPLNLCYKAHTMPSLGNQLQNSLEVMDLSSGRKILEEVDKTPANKVKNHSTVPNFHLNERSNSASTNDMCDNKDKLETIVENKENIAENKNCKIGFSTPCNKPSYQERNERQLSETEKINKLNKDEQLKLKENLKCYSERKATPSSILTERAKTSNEELNKNKSDSGKKEKISQNERKNGSLKVQVPVQQKSQPSLQSSQSENCCVDKFCSHEYVEQKGVSLKEPIQKFVDSLFQPKSRTTSNGT